jgi:hypothetical protein
MVFKPKHTPPLKHEVDEYITRVIKEWKGCENWGEDETYWFFWQDFDVFTEDIFRLASRTALRDLWEYLITQKVWVNKPTSGAPYATVLQEALRRHPQDDETLWIPYKWTKKEEQERQKVLAIQQAREQAPFKVQDLPEDPTSTSNPPKTPMIEPALPISLAVAIPTSAPTSTIPIVSAPALAELTPLRTPKIAAALSPATCIRAEPQVQPQTPLTLCRNCQATFTSRNRLHKHLRFNCPSILTTSSSPSLKSFDYVQQQITRHLNDLRPVSTSTTSNSPSLKSFDYVQQQITRHLNDLRLRSHPVYPSNQQSRNTPPPAYQLNPHPIRPTTTSREQTKQRSLIQPTMRWNGGSQAKARKGTRILRLLLRLLM